MRTIQPNSPFTPRPAAPRQAIPAPGPEPTVFAPIVFTPSMEMPTTTVLFGAKNPNFQRYLDITTGKARHDLANFKLPKNAETTADGKGLQLPLDHIDTPRFMKGSNTEGAGQGEGESGDEVGEIGKDGQPKPAEGKGKAKAKAKGNEPGEVEEGDDEGKGEKASDGSKLADGHEDWPVISRSEIAKSMEALELPNFELRLGDSIHQFITRWDNISKVGTPGRRHMHRTIRSAITRLLQMYGKSLDLTKILPMPSDYRYLSDKQIPVPKAKAAIIYLMDTSGSMGAEQKAWARNTNFFASTFIQDRYGKINADLSADFKNEIPKDGNFGEGVVEVFLSHDTDPEEVSENNFYHKSKNGGTKFNPSLELIEEMIERRFPISEWNVYVIHYSDGDNSFDDDPSKSIKTLKRLKDKGLNMYGYIQVKSSYSGHNPFSDVLAKNFDKTDKTIRASKIDKGDSENFRKVLFDIFEKRGDD